MNIDTTKTDEEVAAEEPYRYPYLRVQVFTHTEDGGFESRIGFDLDEKLSDVEALGWIGKELNRGDEKVGPAYRNAGYPPLGVGDLIQLGKERWYICQSTGWKQCEKPDSVLDEYKPTADSGKRVRRG